MEMISPLLIHNAHCAAQLIAQVSRNRGLESGCTRQGGAAFAKQLLYSRALLTGLE